KLKKRNWTDWVFRRLRKDEGYLWSITVLITAEIISITYYRALRNSTDSTVLDRICEKILSDEAQHLRYEVEVIAALRSEMSGFAASLASFFHQVLFAGAVLTVYMSHRRVLNRGGYFFRRYFSACWREFFECLGASGRAAFGSEVEG